MIGAGVGPPDHGLDTPHGLTLQKNFSTLMHSLPPGPSIHRRKKMGDAAARLNCPHTNSKLTGAGGRSHLTLIKGSTGSRRTGAV